jgi:hypothetical protein
VSDRLRRLESLLERVRANVLRRRTEVVAAAPPPVSDTLLRSVPSAPAVDEAEPVPLVRVAITASAFESQAELPADAPNESFTPFSVTGEVSTLELVESEPPDALTESDLVDMSSELLQSLPPPVAGGWPSQSPSEDEPPISSQRPRLPSDLEANLQASGESAAGDESDVRLMTPPPESGPQEAPPGGLFAPAVPDVDNLRAEAPPMSQGSAHGPTPEQIGESIDLEERGGPSLELDTARARPDTMPPKEELEALLNPPPSVGIYDESLLPPPEARAELVAHDRRFATPREAATDAGRPSFTSEGPVVENDGTAPEVFSPALASGGAPELRMPTTSFRPQTFVELLDASIALGA